MGAQEIDPLWIVKVVGTIHTFEKLESSLRTIDVSSEEREDIMDDARMDLGESLLRACYATRGPSRK